MKKIAKKERVRQFLLKIQEQDKGAVDSLTVQGLLEREELQGIGQTTIRNALTEFKQDTVTRLSRKNEPEAETEPESTRFLLEKARKRGLALKKTAVRKHDPVPGTSPKHTILVVDDEQENLRAVASTLEEQYEVLTAEDGLAGLELVRNHPQPDQIHMIISDQRMPRMTGVEFLEKTVTITPKTIRIILTGFTEVDDIIDSINKGQVYKFITKPIDPKDLLVTVKRALEAYELDRTKTEIENRLIRCPQTGLYNRAYLLEYMTSEIKNGFEYKLDGSLIFMELDNVSDITLNFGISTLNDITMGIAYVLGETAAQNQFLFRLEGPAFACYLPFTGKEAARELAEQFRHAIETSEVFIKPVSISAGVVSFSEFFQSEILPDVQSEVFNLAHRRLNKAHLTGNRVYYESGDLITGAGKILIIDSDSFAANVLKQRLERENLQVVCCEDGVTGLALIETERPDVILSELMLPGVDGFLIREKTMASSDLKQKVFIFMSHLKNEDTIQRAAALQIEHYFQKPCIPAEIVGLIKTKLKLIEGVDDGIDS